jgi:pyrroloquinoline quinone biosynthesis protein B
VLQIVVLGSAAGGGFPQWNCNTEACRSARAGEALARTQSSIAMSGDGNNWFLFNASPDIRQQINATPQLHPNHDLRSSPIAGVILTNADVDHIAGLLTLRESTPLALYASDRVLATLDDNSIFNVLNPDFVDRRRLILGESFEPKTKAGEPSGLTVEPFAVRGKVALFLEDPGADSNFGTEEGDTVGARVASNKTGEYFFYIPGCAGLTPELQERLRGAPLVLFDGTLWQDNEMIDAGIGVKTGQRMGHISMSGNEGSIAAFENLAVERKIFIHINNSNPVLMNDTRERSEVEAAGWEISYDGMAINL